MLWLFPKLPPVEVVANELSSCDDRIFDLSFLWHKRIPYKVLNDNFMGPNMKVVNGYYKSLLLNDDIDKKYALKIKGGNIVSFNTITIDKHMVNQG